MGPRSAFTDLVSTGEPRLEPMLLALSTDIGRAADGGGAQALHTDQAHREFQRLAATLDRAVGYDPQKQMELITEMVREEFCVGRSEHCTDLADLRPDLVLKRRAGHPVIVAAVCAAAAQRSGLRVAIVASDVHVLIVHREMPRPVLVNVSRATSLVTDVTQLRDARLSWRCGHEVSALILDLVAERSGQLGLHPVTVRARELAMALPLEHTAIARREVDLHRARSAWN